MYSNAYIFFSYAAFYIAVVIFSFLVNGILLKFSSNLGVRNPDNSTIIRWSSTTKPSLGGITFFMVFLLSLSIYSIFFESKSSLMNLAFIGQIATIALAFIMGLADDAYNTKPLLKLLVQIACGVILITTGTHIQVFENQFINYALTILWIIGMMNSINMLDNMDAITSVVSFGILCSALIIIYLKGDITSVHAFMIVGLLAAITGFLFYNWHPSKMYMGDTGSQLLGIILGVLGILFFWNNQEPWIPNMPSKQIIITVLAFILPITDTTTVVINRLMRKQSPFVGGKDHTTHHLSYLGLSDSQVAILFLFLSLVSTILILVIFHFLKFWEHLYSFIFGLYIIIVFSTLYSITKIKRSKS
jgi:UDP-GlcNAc:undecaprenyl-phosphate/decaprenyl-phosphate GlcNAc-1-phosphate transferase